MKQIREYVSDFLMIENEEIIVEIASYARLKDFRKKERIVVTGERITDVSFLVRGAAKSVSVSEDGREKVHEICCAPYGPVPIADFNIFKGISASVDIVSLSKCVVLLIPVDKLKEFARRHAEVQEALSGIYISAIRRIFNYINILHTYQNNLFGLYKYYIEHLPMVIANSTLEELSSFFGVSIYQLSRVKNRYKAEFPIQYEKMFECKKLP